MIEVFKTNIDDTASAQKVLELLKSSFPRYRANFDLDDADRILRIESKEGWIYPEKVILVVTELGFHAEVLEDVVTGVKLPDFQLYH